LRGGDVNALRARLDARASESGLSLIEVIIAMMIFAMIATGIGYSMLAALNLTKDSTARQQAANLAAQEIDLTRSIDNLFNLVDKTTTTTINGITYTITRTARWVSDPDVDQRCGIGGGILRYKRVNVTVAWTGMTSTTPSVRADTLIDPGVRINDPDLGTVLISVTDSGGNPVVGATVKVTPATPADGAQSLDEQPAVTDSEGCTYALKVDPGNYDVVVSKSGYIDVTQNATPSVLVSVKKSSATAAMTTLDLGASFPVDFTTNYEDPVQVPTNIDVSFVSTYGTSIASGSSMSPVTRFPFPAGYEVLAGVYNDPKDPAKTCKAVDPKEWAAGTTDGVAYLDGVTVAPVAALPGGTAATANVGMGVAGVPIPNRSGGSSWYLYAVSQSAGPTGSGNPGCDIAMTYQFGKFSEYSDDLDFTLPYGSWIFYTASSFSGDTPNNPQVVSASTMHFHTNVHVSGNVVTFDPRAVAP
jgi:prepilin-type N-terminal cleavage/methylation domain-containing protein